MSYDDLSVQMGTSVKMLEEHYSHFTVSDNPNKFAGHEKREDQVRKQEQDESAVLIKQMSLHRLKVFHVVTGKRHSIKSLESILISYYAATMIYQ